MTDQSWDLLARYIGSQAGIFKCPADPRVAYYPAAPAIANVVRSISCNQGVGTIPSGYNSGDPASTGRPPSSPVFGPWLTGSHNEAYSQYVTFGKSTDFRICSPSDIWIYADDDPWTINDAAMAVSAGVPAFVDYPSPMHRGACGFSFADGHAESHTWNTSGYPLVPTSDPGYYHVPTAGPLYSDWYWFAWHASRSKTTGTVP